MIIITEKVKENFLNLYLKLRITSPVHESIVREVTLRAMDLPEINLALLR